MNHNELMKSKIINRAEWKRARAEKQFETVVFTNGCFDILHRGHVEYLAQARNEGDCLIVGLNSDDSVRRLKGDNRPINQEDDRALLLAALECVDYVILFDEDTPESLIRSVEPDVLVKGGDYTPDTIAGAKFVLSRGGIVQVIPFVDGYSTSRTIQQINQQK